MARAYTYSNHKDGHFKLKALVSLVNVTLTLNRQTMQNSIGINVDLYLCHEVFGGRLLTRERERERCKGLSRNV